MAVHREQLEFFVEMRGVPGFVRDAQRVERQMQRLEYETGRVRTGFKKIGPVAAAARGSFRMLRRTLAAMTIAAGFAAVRMGTAFIGFEDQVRGAAAVAGTTLKERQVAFKSFYKEAIRVGKAYRVSNEEAASALQILSQAGFNANDAVKTLEGTVQLALATNSDMTQATQAQVTVLGGFQMGTEKAAHVADVLTKSAQLSQVNLTDLRTSMKYIAPVAHTVGTDFEDVATALTILGKAGIKGSQAGTSLRHGLLRLVNPTAAAEEGLKKIGLSADQLKGPKGLKPLGEILATLRTHLKGVKKSERIAALGKIFPVTSVTAWVNLLDTSQKSYDKMNKKIEGSKGVAKTSADFMVHTIGGALDNMKDTITGTMAELIFPHSKEIQDWIRGVSKWIGQLSNSASPARKQIGPLVDFIKNLARFAWGAGKALWKGLIVSFKVIRPILKAVNAHFDTLVTLLGGAGGVYLTLKAIQKLKIAKWWIVTSKATLATANWRSLSSIVSALATTLSTNPMTIWIVAIGALIVGFIILYKRVKWFRDAVDTTVKWIKDAFWWLIGWIKKHWALLLGILTGPFGLAIEQIIVHWGDITNFFKQIPGFFVHIMRDVGLAIKKAFWSAINWVKGKWGDFVGWIWDKIPGPLKRFLGGDPGAAAKQKKWQDWLNKQNAAAQKQLGIGPKKKAGGGLTRGPTVVGERGPELINFPRTMRVFPNSVYNRFAKAQQGGFLRSGGSTMVGEMGPEILNLPTGSSVVPTRPADVMKFGDMMNRIGPETILTQISIDGRKVAEAVHSVAQERAARR